MQNVKMRKIVGIILAAVLTLGIIPVSAVAESLPLELTVSCDCKENEKLEYGGFVTVSVQVGETNPGFSVCTFYFEPSDNLTCISATLLGNEAEIQTYSTDDLSDKYGIAFIDKNNYTEKNNEICTMMFRVDGMGEAKVDVSVSQVLNRELKSVDAQVKNSTVLRTVKTPKKPEILTESLPNGAVGTEYCTVISADYDDNICFEIIDGRLPQGITMQNDGTISGIPSEYGEYSITVTVTFADAVTSDPVVLDLLVLETPKVITVNENSRYMIKDGYLLGVRSMTALKTVLSELIPTSMIRAYGKDGTEISNKDGYAGTGCKLCLDDGGNLSDTVTVVVKGDADGDGEIGAFDYVRIRLALTEQINMSKSEKLAADVDGDGEIGAFDYVRVRLHLLGTINIFDN